MAIHKSEALILERRDFRETSYILTLFTLDFGKISAQAKGARRKIDKFGTNFLPLTLNKVVFYENSYGNLHILSQIDLLDYFDKVGDSVEKFTSAMYFLELVNSTMPWEQKNTAIFNLLMDFLRYLNQHDRAQNIRQIFEIKFLKLSGFKPHFDSCVHCGAPIKDECRFSYTLGGLLCNLCRYRDVAAKPVMPGTVATIEYLEENSLDKIPNFKISGKIQKELELILRNFIEHHLGQRFKSLEFLEKLRVSYV
ncbi:MAG: DNA repair protein RecO [Candidatus Omnitrophica bacterium]|nr:DNA repair protein RecO [Candidatus Omnitrophota bacterium]MBU1925949.1 DNA repair protein RecO [Candidatus Omnitrophota bacterium]MBU2063602.1 DNA repair protein RecO [Candidatus Omnitrophota bacterium]